MPSAVQTSPTSRTQNTIAISETSSIRPGLIDQSVRTHFQNLPGRGIRRMVVVRARHWFRRASSKK